MHQNDSDPINENFSDDPIENLRLENDILKLKMQAQFGANTQISSDLPPAIENEFLQNVQRFEEAWQSVQLIKVYDLIGKPSFKSGEDINPENIKIELARVERLLADKSIYLHVHGEYDPYTIYQFITEELFENETEDIQVEGFQKNFIYEEFHPNHRLDLEKNTGDFFSSWFTKNFDEYSLELSDMMINFDGTQFTHDEMICKLNETLKTIKSFSNEKFEIQDISFEWKEHDDTGMGYTEGLVSYDAAIDTGDHISVKGPFKFYFCNELGYWNIFYFILPGFEW